MAVCLCWIFFWNFKGILLCFPFLHDVFSFVSLRVNFIISLPITSAPPLTCRKTFFYSKYMRLSNLPGRFYFSMENSTVGKKKRMNLQKLLSSFRFIYFAITFSLYNYNSRSSWRWLVGTSHRFNCLLRH